jgi:RHS repeat-associated protein
VETDTAAGAWAIIYEEMALVGADGSVHPLYTGQTSSPLGAGTGSSGVTGRGSTVDTNRNKAIYPTTTTYYHTDGVGTALLISQGGGWPVWQGLFAPFGQEVDTQPSIDQNKFATYQHESESNLEHAGFRKYASIQGRFTSPDPFLGSIDLANPQSWNRYAYAGNTPMIAADPLGLFVHDPMWSGISGGGTAGMWYSGGLSSPCTLDGVATPCGSIGGGLGGNEVAALPPGMSTVTSINGGYYFPTVDANGNLGYSFTFEATYKGVTLTDAALAEMLRLPTTSGDDPANNTTNPPPCREAVLNAANNRFGTNYTSANVGKTFQYSTGAPPGVGTLNLNIFGSTAGVSPGYYPVHWWTYVIGYGPTLHAVSGPGGHGGLDSQQTLQFSPNQATFHIDSGFPYNPIGAFFHWLLNMTNAGGYPAC